MDVKTVDIVVGGFQIFIILWDFYKYKNLKLRFAVSTR